MFDGDLTFHKLTEQLNRALRDLLQDKHLYQHVMVDLSPITGCELYPEKTHPETMSEKEREAIGIRNLLLRAAEVHVKSPSDAPFVRPPLQGSVERNRKASVSLHVPTLMAICATCGARHPFNLIGARIVSAHDIDERLTSPTGPFRVETYAFEYQCQACKSSADVFLVRRDDWRLTLCGRSPIEQVDVPRFIPRAFRPYYRRAVVARNSGEVLAGLFLLRVLIEQFVLADGYMPQQAQGDQDDEPEPELAYQRRAADAIEKYMETLPDDFTSRFPSLRKIYQDLSADIHSATGSEELFEASLSDIERHFDASRLFKMNDN